MIEQLAFKCWFWFGSRFRFFNEYTSIQNTALLTAKRALEDAFSPQLQSMIEDGYICDECGRYNEETNEINKSIK